MKRLKIYILIMLMLLVFSCDGKIVIVNCEECTVEEPKTADLSLILEPENGNYVQINVYKGIIEDNLLIDSFVTSSTQYTYNVNVNVKYTFTAEYDNYAYSGKTLVVVNTAYPRVRYEKEQCQNNCYFVYGKKVNLKVKYH